MRRLCFLFFLPSLLASLFFFSAPGYTTTADASVLDQYYDTGQDGYFGLRRSTYLQVAQSFTASISGNVEYVELYLLKYGSPTGNIWASIYSDNSNKPGTEIATGNNVDASTVPTSYGWVSLSIMSPLPDVTAGTQYWIVLSGDYAISVDNHIRWGTDTTSPEYGGGMASTSDGDSWNVYSGTDGLFREYLADEATPTPTPTATPAPTMAVQQYTQTGITSTDATLIEIASNSAIAQGLHDFFWGQAVFNVIIIFCLLWIITQAYIIHT